VILRRDRAAGAAPRRERDARGGPLRPVRLLEPQRAPRRLRALVVADLAERAAEREPRPGGGVGAEPLAQQRLELGRGVGREAGGQERLGPAQARGAGERERAGGGGGLREEPRGGGRVSCGEERLAAREGEPRARGDRRPERHLEGVGRLVRRVAREQGEAEGGLGARRAGSVRARGERAPRRALGAGVVAARLRLRGAPEAGEPVRERRPPRRARPGRKRPGGERERARRVNGRRAAPTRGSARSPRR